MSHFIIIKHINQLRDPIYTFINEKKPNKLTSYVISLTLIEIAGFIFRA